MAADQKNESPHQWLLKTTFPVLTPEMPQLAYDKPEFDTFIKSLVHPAKSDEIKVAVRTKDAQPAAKPEPASTSDKAAESTATTVVPDMDTDSPFMEGLLADKAAVPSFDSRDNKALTENLDVTFATSKNALVDLFYELEDVVSGDRMKQMLEAAWAVDAEATLRIIWNARSIHLGKSSRTTFYRAVGWLAEHHPLTMLTSLPWLVRPIIPKKAPKKDDQKPEDPNRGEAKEADDDFEMVDEKSELEGQPEQKKIKLDDADGYSEFDIKYGVAHGYWKDLLNICALAVNGQLRVGGDIRSVLNVEQEKKRYKQDWTSSKKNGKYLVRHDLAMKKLSEDGFYKALHMTVARLFASQLKTDIAALKSGDKSQMKLITLAAKWAPSHKGMHDQHTYIVSTIAEMVHPLDSVATAGVDPSDRAAHLKLARAALHDLTISPLRKYLDIVERPIAADKFDDIKYDRVPSLAMKQYTPLFIKKDFDRFDKYLEGVASGDARISGATLMPSSLVHTARSQRYRNGSASENVSVKERVEAKHQEMASKVVDGQWKTLCQRIKDSGTLESSIAVVDVSGSMCGPTFRDGTCPVDSAIGLGLLLAEVTQPPFGGAFITFSAKPQVMRVGGEGDERTFQEKVSYIDKSNWSMNTDFTAVFSQLILPMAKEKKLKPEEMVKNVFVFSDMQFDSAATDTDRWTTSFERIQRDFQDAGYEMPKLIFWNLAGGRAGYDDERAAGGDDRAPKPVTAAEENTVLVSGYSQAQMKMFLDNGSFEEPVEEELVEEKDGEDGEVVVEKRNKKQDPLDAVKKAISHDAYRMLKVVD